MVKIDFMNFSPHDWTLITFGDRTLITFELIVIIKYNFLILKNNENVWST
jgi:hypothetical protein